MKVILFALCLAIARMAVIAAPAYRQDSAKGNGNNNAQPQVGRISEGKGPNQQRGQSQQVIQNQVGQGQNKPSAGQGKFNGNAGFAQGQFGQSGKGVGSSSFQQNNQGGGKGNDAWGKNKPSEQGGFNGGLNSFGQGQGGQGFGPSPFQANSPSTFGGNGNDPWGKNKPPGQGFGQGQFGQGGKGAGSSSFQQNNPGPFGDKGNNDWGINKPSGQGFGQGQFGQGGKGAGSSSFQQNNPGPFGDKGNNDWGKNKPPGQGFGQGQFGQGGKGAGSSSFPSFNAVNFGGKGNDARGDHNNNFQNSDNSFMGRNNQDDKYPKPAPSKDNSMGWLAVMDQQGGSSQLGRGKNQDNVGNFGKPIPVMSFGSGPDSNQWGTMTGRGSNNVPQPQYYNSDQGNRGKPTFNNSPDRQTFNSIVHPGYPDHPSNPPPVAADPPPVPAQSA